MKKESGSKILNHPDKELIIKMLSDGESVRKVEAYVKEKHPKDKHLHLSLPTIQAFRKNNLNLEAKVLKDIQDAKAQERKEEEALDKQRQLESINAYRDKINALATNHLDVQTKILQIDAIVGSRIEHWYNMAAGGQELPQRADKELREYITQQIEILKQYKKLVEGMADKTIDYNISIKSSMVQDQISVIRDAIVEIIRELDTETAMLFMSKFHNALQKLEYIPKVIEVDSDIKDISLLTDGDNNE